MLAHNGMRFELTDEEPVMVAIRTALDRDNVPVVQLLGRHDPRKRWTVLPETTRG